MGRTIRPIPQPIYNSPVSHYHSRFIGTLVGAKFSDINVTEGPTPHPTARGSGQKRAPHLPNPITLSSDIKLEGKSAKCDTGVGVPKYSP